MVWAPAGLFIGVMAILGVLAAILLLGRSRSEPERQESDGTAFLIVGICFLAVSSILAVLGVWGWFGVPVGIVFVAVGAAKRAGKGIG